MMGKERHAFPRPHPNREAADIGDMADPGDEINPSRPRTECAHDCSSRHDLPRPARSGTCIRLLPGPKLSPGSRRPFWCGSWWRGHPAHTAGCSSRGRTPRSLEMVIPPPARRSRHPPRTHNRKLPARTAGSCPRHAIGVKYRDPGAACTPIPNLRPVGYIEKRLPRTITFHGVDLDCVVVRGFGIRRRSGRAG